MSEKHIKVCPSELRPILSQWIQDVEMLEDTVILLKGTLERIKEYVEESQPAVSDRPSVEQMYSVLYLRTLWKGEEEKVYSLLGCNLFSLTEDAWEHLWFASLKTGNYLFGARCDALLQYLRDGYSLTSKKIQRILRVSETTSQRLIRQFYVEYADCIEKRKYENQTYLVWSEKKC